MICINSLTKSYRTPGGRKYVLNNINAVFPDGTDIAILGTNGAGKSTLLRLIGGIDYPDGGKVVTDKYISWPMALSSGFQGSMTGRENSSFVCHIHGNDKDEIRDKIAFVQDFSELNDYFDMPVKTYSSGMRSRLAFALSMAFDFDVYLVDEIMAVGDHLFRKKCVDAFADKRGRANVIMVSHDMATLKAQCQTGAVIRDGKLEMFDDIEDAIATYMKGEQ